MMVKLFARVWRLPQPKQLHGAVVLASLLTMVASMQAHAAVQQVGVDQAAQALDHRADPHDHAGGHDHVPHFEDINWWHGFLGEDADAEPGLLWRKPGTPVPLGAMFLNTALLFFLLIRFGGPKLSAALKARKEGITAGMRQAAEMREEAEERLRDYEEKLASIDQQVTQATQQILDLAKVERERALKEAREKRERMEREARQLIEQELKAARELILEETVRSAIRAARQVIAEQSTPADEHRLQDEYLASVRGTKLSSRGQA
jgi:F-type H+-transporting ATPase subunit b